MTHLLELLAQNWAVAAALGAVALVLGATRVAARLRPPVLERRGSLVTQPQLRLFRALQSAVGGSWSVLPRVPLADVVNVPAGMVGARSWRHKIQYGPHLDFVLAHHDSLYVCLAIELDDVSADSPDRKERDRLIARTLSAAQLPLLRVECAEQYDKVELRRAIDRLLGK